MYKEIYKKIKKYNSIVIARHIGPDPDALASSIALKEIIETNFPEKEVYVVGNSASRFKYLGVMDKLPDDVSQALLIVTDTPDRKRVDGVEIDKFAYRIKIDHHPFVEEFCELEFIDDTASSASQMIIELAFKTKMKIEKSTAEKLYLGVVEDTNRFLHDYTTTKTFDLVSELIKRTEIDFTKLYDKIYMRNFRDIKFSGYIATNLIVNDNGLAYIKLTDEQLKENGVDCGVPGNLIGNFDYIEEIKVLVFLSEDVNNKYIKCNIRSRGPIINEIASHYNGGGHALASGAKLSTFEEADKLLDELNTLCDSSYVTINI